MNQKKLLLLILLSSIACFIIALENEPVVAKVNKHEIKVTEFNRRIQNDYESFYLEHNSTPSAPELRNIELNAWNKMIDGYILKDIFEKYKIVVTQKDLADTLLKNIPESIKKSPKFLNADGQFNFELYETSLKTDKPVDLTWLKQYYYSSYIPMAKLKNYAINNRSISEKDIKNYYVAKNSTAKIKLINFDNKNFSNTVAVSPGEIQDYYRKNITNYEIPATCKLEWVKFPLLPDYSDSLQAKKNADSLYTVLKKGSSFSLIAEKYSDGSYGPKKGYAGFMEIALFPDDIAKKLTDAKMNEILPPFFMNGSYYIISPVDKTINMVKLLVIQIDIKVTENTTKRIKDKIQKFRELANSIGFKNAASEYRFKMLSQDSLSINNTYLQDLGTSESIVRKALTTPEGVIFEPIKHDKSRSFIVFSVATNTKRSFRKVEEVSGDIIDQITRERSKDIAYNAARSFLKKNNKNPLKQADIENLTTSEDNTFNFSSKINGFYSSQINRQILNAKSGDSFVIQTDESSLICIIESITNPDFNNYNSQMNELKHELQTNDAKEYFVEFMKNERAKAKVKDLRKKA